MFISIDAEKNISQNLESIHDKDSQKLEGREISLN